jgi:CO/xanthine dehydrogenase FAD-binding subunit
MRDEPELRVHHAPFTVHRSPFTAHRVPFTVHRSPFSILHSPLTAHRSPFTDHHSPFSILRSPFTVHRSPFWRYHNLQPFDYIKPKTLDEASALLLEHNGQARPVAGCTDLLIRIERGFLHPQFLLDIKALPGMADLLVVRNGDLRIGAAVTMNQVALSPIVQGGWPLLAEACASVASYQLRNRATVGGNLCNASPAADSAPALICYGASVHIFGPEGQRKMPLEQFFLGPGKTALQRGELLTAITVPFLRGAAGHFLKLGRTAMGDISLMNVAVLGWPDADAPSGASWRIALGSVAPTVIRAPEAERLLSLDASPAGLEAGSQAAAAAARPIDDIRATAAYRTDMVRVLTRRGVERVLAEIGRQVDK